MQSYDLIEAAHLLAAQNNQISVSMVQRHLRVGYAKAARIIDDLVAFEIIERKEKYWYTLKSELLRPK